MRARTLPRNAVMERKMYKAVKNSTAMLAGNALNTWCSLLVKFPSPVTFAIVLGWAENQASCEVFLVEEKKPICLQF